MSDNKNNKANKGEGIWNDILASAANQNSSLKTKTVLVLGDRNCGKSSILQEFKKRTVPNSQRFEQQTFEEEAKGVALDYHFINVLDEDSEDILGRINIWQLEGEEKHNDLLPFAVTKESLVFDKKQYKASSYSAGYCGVVVVIALDLAEPWNIDAMIMQWLQVLQDHINHLRLDKDDATYLRNSLEKLFLNYKEPSKADSTRKKSFFMQPTTTKSTSTNNNEEITDDNNDNDNDNNDNDNNDEELVDLPVGVLEENWGIPIIVACCKSDLLPAVKRDFGFKDGHFDFVLQHIRSICIKYGAGLVYCSAKKNCNIDLLHDYVEHLLYGFDFSATAELVEKDAIFIPIGWDSVEKIKVDLDTQRLATSDDQSFADVISKPVAFIETIEKENTVEVEDEQAFLEKNKSTIEKLDSIQRSAASNSNANTPTTSNFTVSATSTPYTPSSTSTPTSTAALLNSLSSTPLGSGSSFSTPTGTPANNDDAQEEEQLTNFFNKLLASSSSPAIDTTSTTDTESQLQKLL